LEDNETVEASAYLVCCISESCIYGDYRGRFYLDAVTSLNCTEIGLQQPWRCYDNSYVTDCCQTCAALRNTSLPAGKNQYYNLQVTGFLLLLGNFSQTLEFLDML